MGTEQTIIAKDHDGNPILLTDVREGNFVKKRYIKCPHLAVSCKWRMSNNSRKGYEYLNDACYLSGSFKLECPELIKQ